jgi:LysM repeat protein
MIQALLVVGLSFFNPQVLTDSLGTETIDGKLFILHRVEEKETLYGISRRYGAYIDDILQYNPNADAGLDIGQILRIPYVKKKANPETASAKNGGIHKVTEKETLYSISRMYGVTIDEIKEWNNLTSTSLKLGQELTIKKTKTVLPPATPASAPTSVQKGVHKVAANETLYSISRQYNVRVADLKKWNNLEGDVLKVDQLLFVAPQTKENLTPSSTAISSAQNSPPAEVPPAQNDPATKTQTVTISENLHDSDEVVQSGVAELIEGTEGNRKYLALHRTAPIGTILKVRNEMNNREVFVRVMGKLPDTAMTDNLVIKISRSAYDRLGAIDPRFRVQVTYYK